MSELVTCDRCQKTVIGLRSESGTGGFYDVTGPPWSRYANDGERDVCDDCMHADNRYRIDQGLSSFYCPRRDDMLSYAGFSPIFDPGRPGSDTWTHRHGYHAGCSYCGSATTLRLFNGIEAGTLELGPTDKGYKVYLREMGDGVCSECHGAGEPGGYRCVVCDGTGCAASGPQVGKFYFQHFSAAERAQFIELHNAGRIRYGYPGYLYRLPYFTRETP